MFFVAATRTRSSSTFLTAIARRGSASNSLSSLRFLSSSSSVPPPDDSDNNNASSTLKKRAKKPASADSTAKPLKRTSTKKTTAADAAKLEKETRLALANAKLAAATAAAAPPAPSRAMPVLLYGEKPLLPEHKAVIGGDAALQLHLPQLQAVLQAQTSKTALCMFCMPSNVSAPRPRVGTLARLVSLNIFFEDNTQYALRDGKVYTTDAKGYVSQEQGLELTADALAERRVLKWDAELSAISFVDASSQEEAKEDALVEYRALEQETATEEFHQAWIQLNQLLAKFFPGPLVQPKTSWRETCAHILYVFQQISGEDMQRVIDAPSAVAGVTLCAELIQKEVRLLEIQQKHSEGMQLEQYKADRAELVRRITREMGGAGPGAGAGAGAGSQDKTFKYKQRMAKFANAVVDEDEQKERERKEEEYWTEQLKLGGHALCMPVNVKKVFDEELAKLETMDRGSEFQTTSNYLDWLLSVPWGRTTAPMYDVERTMDILNRDHYGLEPVKKRIAEFVAVAKLNQGLAPSKILCLEGPPGVGKTSIGKSIAEALNKKFYRFSVGGLHDSSEIKGHRRTYVASRPGKLVECLKQSGAMNPLMMIDEVDKIGRHGVNGGDPSGALLELLDPSQNTAFRDQYLDLEIDASQVLFLCTANDLSQMPRPLKDRMEIIQVSGYDNVEKVEIAKRYLEKRLRRDSGVTEEMFAGLDESILQYLVREYSREPGVRKLTQIMDKIYRAMALEVASKKPEQQIPAISTKEELERYIGKSQHAKERLFGDALPSGVCTGLGANGLEGIMLYIECTSVRRKPDAGSISVTGNLQQTMKESLEVAYANAKHLTAEESEFFADNQLKMHVPYGGIPKDGPSAGLAMTMSLLSLAWNTPLSAFTAMTGEITLTGRIVAIGGVREKTLAARRSGITTLIFPADNMQDWNELADHLKQGMTVHFVSRVEEAIPLCFPGRMTTTSNNEKEII